MGHRWGAPGSTKQGRLTVQNRASSGILNRICAYFRKIYDSMQELGGPCLLIDQSWLMTNNCNTMDDGVVTPGFFI